MTYASDLAASLGSSLSSLTPLLLEAADESDLDSSSPTPPVASQPTTTQHGTPTRAQVIHDRASSLRSILSKLHPSHPASSFELASLLDQAFPSSSSSSSSSLSLSLSTSSNDRSSVQAQAQSSNQLQSIEYVTLAHMTISAYGLVLKQLMQQASDLAQEDEWWADRETDAWNQGLYLLQSELSHRATCKALPTYTRSPPTATPSRLVSLSATLVTRLRDLTTAALHSSRPAPSYLSWSTYRTALPPSLLVTAIFPHLATSTGVASPTDALDPFGTDDSTLAVTSSSGGVSFSHATRLAKKTTRSLFFLTLSPLALTRQEIFHRRKTIRQTRQSLAISIGELTLAPQPSIDGDHQEQQRANNDDGKNRTERTLPAVLTTTDQEPATLDALKDACWTTLVHLTSALATSPNSSSNVPSPPEASKPSSAQECARALHTLLTRTMVAQAKTLETQLEQVSRPPFLTRAWPYLLAVPLVSYGIGRTIYNSRHDLLHYARDAVDTVKRFVMDWVLEPVRGIFETVRGEGGMSLTGKETLKSDLDSLERMVIDFGRDEYKLSEAQLGDLKEKVRAGDLTPVLKAFEHDLKSPLRSAISGSLIRTLLIQVQKVKVDVALAMDGIEKMLRSQQLTFGFVGVAPSILVLFAFGNWVKGFTRRDGSSKKRRKEWGKRCWLSTRQLDLLLAPPRDIEASTKTSKGDRTGEKEKLTQGLVLLCLANLRNYAKRGIFPSRDTQLRQAFLEDVRAIEDEGARAKPEKRAKMVERMWRWGTALGWEGIA
ncbi:BZ3500_MvSof-1268-A1-R1_Chr8-1g09844 [Microbotryum saponariae]|uniref:BZ3500_MvSof-1268-A1-R1_Chr8-1g09844 protein n=1 Tax=Microbotryum saponariae TaxID=289078 RepID=A0A2X0KPU3_9BASI|nr:BZ3500_MvSof-1268-A1-R1_Chr8-1g09844 [Microbotryum saponariae]SDA08130.1 BZ3501_MvSof-1269-A2-R1_Chr8-1g09567 [Microbotryum saponariae]